ncbi:MAG TPA: thioredoxin domain-containing protein [Acidimicrobiales bacterium]|nr:thioredoxin domain-containing protein [Acidimicrobiales bacterium]
MADLPRTRKRLPVRENSEFEELADGTWTVRFAPLGVSATGATQDEAFQALAESTNKEMASSEELQRKMAEWAEANAIEEPIPEEELQKRDELLAKSHAASEKLRALTDSDFDAAIASSKPILVDFWAEWCIPCHMMTPVLVEVAADLADRIDVAKFEIDSDDIEPEKSYWERFEIRGIPCLILFHEGKELHRIVGAGRDKDQLIKELETALP